MKPLSDEDYLRHLSALCAGEDELDMAGPRGLGDLFPCADFQDLDTVADLIDYARKVDLGFALNAGWRCDVPFDKYGIEVCDRTFPQAQHFEVRAATAFGALAAGILAALQNRAQAADRPLFDAVITIKPTSTGKSLVSICMTEMDGRSMIGSERDTYLRIRDGIYSVIRKLPEPGAVTQSVVLDAISTLFAADQHQHGPRLLVKLRPKSEGAVQVTLRLRPDADAE